MIRDTTPFKVVPRLLLLVWCGWMLGSWGLAWLIYWPHMTTLAGAGNQLDFAVRHLPVVRTTLISAMIGLMVVWPVLRLSQITPARPALRSLSDWVSMLLVLQGVIWPLRSLMHWSAGRTLYIDLLLIGWSLPIMVWLAVGWRDRAGRRAIALLGCQLTLLGPVLIGWASGDPALAGDASLAALWQACDPTGPLPVNLAPPRATVDLQALATPILVIVLSCAVAGVVGRLGGREPVTPNYEI